jgi:hypothetical protein
MAKSGSVNPAFMAIVLKVKWVEQSGRAESHQRITHIGGDSGQLQWKHTQAEAIAAIERGLFAYYVQSNTRPLKLDIARAADGTKYLAVESGQSRALLDLPGFPNPAPPGVATH